MLVEAVLAVAADGRCCFAERGAALPAGLSVAADKQALDAIGKMGQTDPQGLALTVAFEGFLSAVVARSWQPAHAGARLHSPRHHLAGASFSSRPRSHHASLCIRMPSIHALSSHTSSSQRAAPSSS